MIQYALLICYLYSINTIICKGNSWITGGNNHLNKSPKGHWSLTWVQWALLLKVWFLSKSESMTAIFLKSVRTATIAIFNSGYGDAFGLLLLHSYLKKKSFGEGSPHWPIFGKLPPPLDPPLGGVAEKPINRCVIMSTSSLSSFINIHQVVL